MANCEHKTCDLDARGYEDEKLCILHSQDPNKDKDDFDKTLEDYRNGGRCDFSSILFSDYANFSGTTFSKMANFQRAITSLSIYVKTVPIRPF